MQMEFGSQVETLFAMAATTKWLKELLTRVEKGILDLGLVIEKKEMWRYEKGGVEPVFTVKRPNSKWTIQLCFWNTIMEFLSLDRDAKPMRFDLRIMNDGFAEKKIDDLVKSRLAIAVNTRATLTPEPEMATGIAAFQNAYGKKATDGYIITFGQTYVSLTPEVTTLPFSVL